MNSIYLMPPEEYEARRAHLQALADQHRACRLPLPESATERDALIDAGAVAALTDEEIIEQTAVAFDLSPLEAVERLAAIDFAAARVRYEVVG